MMMRDTLGPSKAQGVSRVRREGRSKRKERKDVNRCLKGREEKLFVDDRAAFLFF